MPDPTRRRVLVFGGADVNNRPQMPPLSTAPPDWATPRVARAIWRIIEAANRTTQGRNVIFNGFSGSTFSRRGRCHGRAQWTHLLSGGRF
jgi:hypothetical protein